MSMIPCHSWDEDEGIEANVSVSKPTSAQHSFIKHKKCTKIGYHTSPNCPNMHFTCPQEVKDYLPIKKRRLKNATIEKEIRPPSHSTAIYYTDNSGAWWLHANQSGCKTARRPSQPVDSSKDLTKQTQRNPQQVTPNRGRSNIELLQKHNLDKDDPRSAEYHVWFDTYYPINSVPPSLNKLLDKLKLVNPEEVGGKYPPWVSTVELSKWDINVTRPVRDILSSSEAKAKSLIRNSTSVSSGIKSNSSVGVALESGDNIQEATDMAVDIPQPTMSI